MAHDKGNHYFRRVLQGVETSVSDSHESSNAIAGVEIVGKKRVRPGYEIQSSASVKMVFASAFSPAKTAALPAGGILPFILPNWQQAAIKQAGSPRQISRQSVVNGNAGITPILPGIPPFSQDLGKFWPEIPQSCHLSCQNGRISLAGQFPGHCVRIAGPNGEGATDADILSRFRRRGHRQAGIATRIPTKCRVLAGFATPSPIETMSKPGTTFNEELGMKTDNPTQEKSYAFASRIVKVYRYFGCYCSAMPISWKPNTLSR